MRRAGLAPEQAERLDKIDAGKLVLKSVALSVEEVVAGVASMLMEPCHHD